MYYEWERLKLYNKVLIQNNVTERGHLKDLSIGGIILKKSLRKLYETMN
jgi:hypothetical protein